jgi:voltage-gated potassium channel
MRVLKKVLSKAVEMRWSAAIAITFAHAWSTYAGFRLLGEPELVTSWVQFVYFYIVTGSSVGYGDFSPATDAGKLYAALWVIPGAISLFALMIGKIVGSVTLTMRKIMNGFGDFSNKTGHVVVIGHVAGQTEKLLDETRRLHGTRDVVIVASEDLSGQQADWSFVRATSLSRREDLSRSGIKGADFIVVLGRDDDESLAACLAVSALDPCGHVVAYFREEGGADLVRAHCPQIEVVTSISTEQVARALSDPGAGEVLRRLVSTKLEGTLNSMVFHGATRITAADLSTWLRSTHQATLIGRRTSPDREPDITLQDDTEILEGQVIYYIAAKRLPEATAFAA